MMALRHTRRTGRYLAVWLLLWFAIMGLQPRLTVADPGVACAESPDAAATGHAGHPDHEEHGDREAAACGHTQEHDHDGGHAGHASASVLHCALCLHVAAPPPLHIAIDLEGAAPSERVALPPTVHLRVRAAAPPPARGPPHIS